MSLISSGFVLLLVVVFGALVWYSINNTFHGKLFYYRMLKLRAISGKTSTSADGWTKAENTLGGDFKKFIPAMDRDEFDNSKTYLTKAGDLGRQPLPFWLMAVIGILIIAEGLGFSYLLGTFIAPEGTADTYTLLMVALVLVLCVVLGMIMHAAGHQLYRTRLIGAARVDWQQTNARNDRQFKTHEVSLHQPQTIDDGEIACTQLVNRVGDNGKYTMVYVAVCTILAIAVLSTFMRMMAHEKTEAQNTMGTQTSADVSNPFGATSPNGLPASVTASNDKANVIAATSVHDAAKSEAMSAFIILAVIFVITQIVAIYAGFKWGFGGKESPAAYKRTRGFASWTEVREVRGAFVEPVEELMTGLHAKFSETNRKLTIHSFKQYLAKTASEAATDDYPPAAVVPAAAPAQMPAPAAVPVPAAAPHGTVQSHLDALDALGDKTEKEQYVLSLDAATRAEIIAAIKARHQRDAAAKEVEGLF
ncbi:hypothetical protein [Massilia sp. S19_KUP03_FR1]|uniref:hypothetical protein n=1 Tax=Massilia sp. S19_KUP03_FR1 TaxID=3025503 RepID=UPI002FCDC6BE